MTVELGIGKILRQREKKAAYLLLTLGLTGAVSSFMLPFSEVKAQSIQDALGLAYVGNADLQAERSELHATDEKVPAAYANWMPKISLTGEVESALSSQTNTDNDSHTDIEADSLTGTLSLSQTLFAGGANFSKLENAENLVKAQRSALKVKEQEVLLQAATAYVDVIRDQAVVDLRTNHVEVLQRQLEATQDRFQVGENTRTDVAQAEARLSEGRAALRDAQATLAASQATYEKIIGQQPGALEAPKDSSLPLPDNLQSAIEMARTVNPNVSYRHYIAEAAGDDVDTAIAALLPTVSVSASLSREWENARADTRTDAAAVKGTVSVPLFQGGGEYAAIRQSKHTAVQRKQEYNSAILAAVESATKSWEDLESTAAKITSYEESVRANGIALEGVRQEAAVGSRTLLDVLDAEQEALDARVNLVGAERERVVASFTLLSSVGKLTAKDLALDVPLYDDEAHLDDVEFKLIGTGID